VREGKGKKNRQKKKSKKKRKKNKSFQKKFESGSSVGFGRVVSHKQLPSARDVAARHLKRRRRSVRLDAATLRPERRERRFEHCLRLGVVAAALVQR
jgi:hypothetical protein